MNKLTEKFKSVGFGPRYVPHLPNFGRNKNFSQKQGFVTFSCILNPNLMRYSNKTAGQMDAWTAECIGSSGIAGDPK